MMSQRNWQQLIGQLARIGDAAGGAPQPAALLRAVEQAANSVIGHQLFTVMVVHHDTLEVERIYSNMPDVYPIAGRKHKRDTAWGRQVIEQARPYIGYASSDLEQVFDDHELIASLGLASVLNMPVRYDGRCVGTMNLLDRAGAYHKSQLPSAKLIASQLLPALL